MVLDSEKLEKNALTLIKKFPDAKKFLQKADGKKNYQQVAEELMVNPKTISPALSLAKDLGFAKKIKPGIYKKITSNMKYIPKTKEVKKEEIIEKSKNINKMIKKKFKFPSLPNINSVPFDSPSNAEKMAGSYMWLYYTENILRELIRKVMIKQPGWWKTRVNLDIQKKVAETMKNYSYHGANRKDELEYTHLGQLKQIIISKQNWLLFVPFLKEKNKSSFEATIDKAIPSRNSIAHCTLLTTPDFKIVDVRFNDILNMIN